MSSSAQAYYEDMLEEVFQQGYIVHNKEASSLGISPYKYIVAKNIRLLFSEHKATLPFYYAAMMQRYVDELFEKGEVNG